MTLEAFLARLYVDPGTRTRFLAAPEAETRAAGLSPEAEAAVLKIDRVGLELFAASLAHKRGKQQPPRVKRGLPSRLLRFLKR